MADISSDISDLWWLKQEPPRSSVPALALGAQIAQHKMDSARQAEQLKVQTSMKMMDTMLERERNDIALMSFRAKQTADLMKQRGMAELGEYMGKVVAGGKTTDPEARAGLYRLAAKYPLAIDTQMLNSIDDNIFKAAMDREAKASGVADSPASVDEFNFRETLRGKYRDETDPVLKAERLEDLRKFEVKAGFTKGDPLSIEEVVGPDGKSHQVLRSPNGQSRLLPTVDESKISPLDLATYKAELKALQDAWANMDDIILTDKKPDAEKYRRLRDELYSRFSKAKAGTTAPPATPSGTAPAFRFDPATRQLVPIR